MKLKVVFVISLTLFLATMICLTDNSTPVTAQQDDLALQAAENSRVPKMIINQEPSPYPTTS